MFLEMPNFLSLTRHQCFKRMDYGALISCSRKLCATETGAPSTLPFGGKPLLLGGDFRQTLPVVPRGTRAQIIEACIKSSSLWRHFRQLRLSSNMRTGGTRTDFTEWLLKIGDGVLSNDAGLGEDTIEIPTNMVEHGDLVTSIFGDHIDVETVTSLAER